MSQHGDDTDGLSEIRQEYKEKKNQLKKYDTFIDRHQGLIVGLPLILTLVGTLLVVGITSGATEQTSDNLAARIIGLLSLVSLLAAIVLAFITGSRKSAKAKLDKQLDALKDEATLFQKHTKDHDSISRDELGLWRDIEKDTQKSHHKAIGISIVVTVLAVLSAPFVFSQISNHNNGVNQAATQADNQTQANQAQCLNDAYNTYEAAWKAADKDGDGSVSYSDGATDITTSYFDSTIACYRTYKTADSEGYITDYQAKRQQEVDKYTAWLEASKQPTYVPTYNSNYRSSMSCTSRSIGSSVYTDCY